MEIWSHRGRASLSNKGNNLRDFERAEKMDITGIETDIAFDESGRIMVFHPDITKPGLDLEAFLDWIKAYSSKMWCLDIKQFSEELVRKSVSAVVERGLEEKIYFTAFQKRTPLLTIESDGKLLLLAKDVCPDVKTHLMVIWPINLIKLAEKYRPDAISIGWLNEPWQIKIASRLLFKLLVQSVNLKTQIEKVKKNGIKVWAGIFNNQADMKYFTELGVDGIFTDNPPLAVKFFKR